MSNYSEDRMSQEPPGSAPSCVSIFSGVYSVHSYDENITRQRTVSANSVSHRSFLQRRIIALCVIADSYLQGL